MSDPRRSQAKPRRSQEATGSQEKPDETRSNQEARNARGQGALMRSPAPNPKSPKGPRGLLCA